MIISTVCKKILFLSIFFLLVFFSLLNIKNVQAGCEPPECSTCNSNETCSSFCCVPSGGGGGGGGGSCFPAGTKVSMSTGGKNNIENIKIGDTVVGGDGTISAVASVETPVRENLCQIDFASGKNLKLTIEHPVMTTNGWESISPGALFKENPDLSVKQLKIGDDVVRERSSTDKVTRIACRSEVVQTYNLLLGNGSHTYYADGVLVHNKAGRCPGGCCEGGPNYNVCGVCGNPPCCNSNVWSGWCSATCGWGVQYNQCGGTRACLINDPNAWSGWGGCSTSCGGGVQYRVNQCGTWQSQGCMVNNPNAWGGWSGCSTTCGLGTQSRTNQCGTRQSQGCMINNPNVWSGWGACSAACGWGTQYRVNNCGTWAAQACMTQICNTPPVACFNSGIPPTGLPSSVVNYSGTSSDAESNMNRTEVYWRMLNAISGVWGPWNLFKQDVYTNRNTFGFTGAWTPSGVLGSYQLVVNAYDSMGGQCSGNPDLAYPNGGWANCSTTCDLLSYRTCGIPPSDPTGNLCSATNTSMTLSWAALTPAAWGDVCVPPIKNLYTVYADTSANPTTAVCTNISATSCVVSGITAGVTYNWKVVANNGELVSASPGIYVCPAPLLVKDWFTGVNGDIYANGISVSVPSAAAWSSKAIGYGTSSIFNSGNANTAVVNGTVVAVPSTGLWADRMPLKNLGSMWNPYKSTFDIPTGLSNVSSWKNLDPDIVYEFPGASLSSTVNYTFLAGHSGVVVVYLTTNAPSIKIDKNIIAPDANSRLILVTNKPVVIGSGVYTLGDVNLTTSSTPNIQAAIITSSSIAFETATANPSIVVEGPLIARGGLTFGRSPLSTYTYPSEVVVYNPLILNKLTSQERASSTYNYTGLFTSEIIWEGDL